MPSEVNMKFYKFQITQGNKSWRTDSVYIHNYYIVFRDQWENEITLYGTFSVEETKNPPPVVGRTY